eukprot:1863451-Pyramimonas_sp.AAC.1
MASASSSLSISFPYKLRNLPWRRGLRRQYFRIAPKLPLAMWSSTRVVLSISAYFRPSFMMRLSSCLSLLARALLRRDLKFVEISAASESPEGVLARLRPRRELPCPRVAK